MNYKEEEGFKNDTNNSRLNNQLNGDNINQDREYQRWPLTALDYKAKLQ